MRISKPAFREDVEWVKIPRNGRPWKYRVKSALGVKVSFDSPVCRGTYYLMDGDDNCWGVITPRSIMACQGYAWNGSTCSPDAGVLLASLIHDILYQFSGCYNFPFSRKFCDNLFYQLANSPLKPLYRLGLLVCGGAFWEKTESGSHINSP